MWGFKPNKPLILDDSLNIKILKIQSENEAFAFILENFKGFDIKSNPFKNVVFSRNIYKIWSISFSNFDFYYKNLLVYKTCDEQLMINFSNENQFNGFMLSFDHSIKYSLNTCPIIFSNINLRFINLGKISNSFIEKNILGFQNISDALLNRINSSIFQLNLLLYHTDLNSNLLNKYVFAKIKSIDLNGQITGIQDDLFKSFGSLRMIRIRMQNIQNILVRNNKWFDHLNFDLNIDPMNVTQVYNYDHRIIVIVFNQQYYKLTFYGYPEQDFCYFKNFPHNKLVFPKLIPNYKSKCSCTELFLIQYSYLYSSSINYYLGKTPSKYYLSQYYIDGLIDNIFTHCMNSSFKQALKNCNFEKRLNLCKISSNGKKKEEAYFYMNDWETLSKHSQIILSLYMNPIFSIISILFNLLIFIILSNKKEIPKEMNKMYSYLKINSMFNIILIIIRLFKLIDTCSNEDLICISIYSKSKNIQYFKIIFIRIIGNTFQAASNLTHITYTLSRYITVSNNKSNFLNFIHQISFKMYSVGILLFSFLLNIHIFFEYSIFNETTQISQLKTFDFKKINSYKQEPFDDYKENFSHSEYLILDIFQYIKIIFSDIFYIITSFLIDLILILFIKKSMSKKERLTVTFVVNVNRVIIGPIENQAENNDQTKRKKKTNSVKNKMTLIIILNGFNFIFFRLPLAILSFYGFFIRYDIEENKFKPNLIMYIICRFFKFCISLNSFFYFFYLNSFILQFFIFYNLDKNFKKSLKSIKKYLKNKYCYSF